MKNGNIIIVSLFLVLLFSCKKEEEIVEAPVVYDETGMLGLADSPWPCDGHDSRRTSQSQYNGPANVTGTMIYDSSPTIHHSDAVSPAIDANGNLYCAAWVSVLKFSAGKSFEWVNEADVYLRNIPPVSKDGIIYIGGFDQYGIQNYTDGLILAIDESNNLKWKYEFPDEEDGGVFGALAIASNGTIYTVDKSDGIFAINASGKKLWSYKLESKSYSSPAIAPDGTIYAIDYDNNIYAVKPTGELLWKYPVDKDINYDPAVAVDGTVYIGTANSLLAVGLDGVIKWEYSLPDAAINRPSIASDGTIFIACADLNLYAVNFDGTAKWQYNSEGYITSPVTIDAAGSIYFGTNGENSKLISLTSSGAFRWEYPVSIGYGQPVIDADGTLYVGANDGKIYMLTSN